MINKITAEQLLENNNYKSLFASKMDNDTFLEELNKTIFNATVDEFHEEFLNIFTAKYFRIYFYQIDSWLSFKKRVEMTLYNSAQVEKYMQLLKLLKGKKVYYKDISKEHFTDIILLLREFASLCYINISLNEINNIIESRFK